MLSDSVRGINGRPQSIRKEKLACFSAGGYRDSRPTWPFGARFHQPDWQPNVGHHWRQTGNGVSLSVPVNGHPKIQSCRFPWHFPFSDWGRGLIFQTIIFYNNNNISRGIISTSGKKIIIIIIKMKIVLETHIPLSTRGQMEWTIISGPLKSRRIQRRSQKTFGGLWFWSISFYFGRNFCAF